MKRSGLLLVAMLFLGGIFLAPSFGHADERWDRRGAAADKWRDGSHGKQYEKHGKQKHAQHGKDRDRRDAYHQKGQGGDKWRGNHDRRDRYAPPVRWDKHQKHYVKPKPHAHRHAGPKYVYVKHVHTPRYYGTHLYRGFHWPFINVTIVLPLSQRQIEHHHQAVYIALDASVGQVTRWQDGHISGSVVVLREGVNSYGSHCREYRQTLSEPGRTVSRVEISCLDRHGYWIPV